MTRSDERPRPHDARHAAARGRSQPARFATTADRAEGIAAFLEKSATQRSRANDQRRGRNTRHGGRSRDGCPSTRWSPTSRSTRHPRGPAGRRPGCRRGAATRAAGARAPPPAGGRRVVHPGPPTAWADFTAMTVALGAGPPWCPAGCRHRRTHDGRARRRSRRGCSPPPRSAPVRQRPLPSRRCRLHVGMGRRCAVAVLGTTWATPLVGLLLARLGADVVRVDDPRREDPSPGDAPRAGPANEWVSTSPPRPGGPRCVRSWRASTCSSTATRPARPRERRVGRRGPRPGECYHTSRGCASPRSPTVTAPATASRPRPRRVGRPHRPAEVRSVGRRWPTRSPGVSARREAVALLCAGGGTAQVTLEGAVGHLLAGEGTR